MATTALSFTVLGASPRPSAPAGLLDAARMPMLRCSGGWTSTAQALAGTGLLVPLVAALAALRRIGPSTARRRQVGLRARGGAKKKEKKWYDPTAKFSPKHQYPGPHVTAQTLREREEEKKVYTPPTLKKKMEKQGPRPGMKYVPTAEDALVRCASDGNFAAFSPNVPPPCDLDRGFVPYAASGRVLHYGRVGVGASRGNELTSDGLKEARRWLEDGGRMALVVTSPGLDEVVRREIKLRYGRNSISIGLRPCFRWRLGKEAPLLNSASRTAVLFWISSHLDCAHIRRAGGDIGVLETKLEAACKNLLETIPVEMQGRAAPVKFAVSTRPSGHRAIGMFFDEYTTEDQIAACVKRSITRCLGWEHDTSNPELEVAAFIAEDHVALGIEREARTAYPSNGQFRWSDVDAGMNAHMAGAMAWMALEPLMPRGARAGLGSDAAIIDPCCGTGTLLLAAARIWPDNNLPALIGRDLNNEQAKTCKDNFERAGIGAEVADIENGSGHHRMKRIADGSAVAVVCDLPCGRQYVVGAMPRSHQQILQEAARVLRPGGRCVLLTSEDGWLTESIEAGPWKTVANIAVGRGDLRDESKLITLERLDGVALEGEAQGDFARRGAALTA